MDIHQLLMLRELHDRGSVTAVAEALGVSSSAVSQHLSALQRGFAVPLTVKSGRRLVLTDAGRALAEAAVGVADALAVAEASVETFLEDETQTVSVAAFHSAGLAWFEGLLETLGPNGPRVRFTDEDVSFADFPALTGRHDIVIAHRLPHGPDWPHDRVHVTPLLTEPIDVALATSHPLARRHVLTPAELVGERWVAVHEGFPLSTLLEQLAAHAGRPLEVAHRINEFFVTAAVVRSGTAIALLPRMTLGARELDGIVLRRVEGITLTRQIDALVRPEALPRAAVRRVLAALREVTARPT
jgi:DNA-binding transcriptional LysR family regulator